MVLPRPRIARALHLFRAGKFAEGETVFREDLHRNPHNPRSLFGLWKSVWNRRKKSPKPKKFVSNL